MQLPNNATLREKERFAYINGDVEKSKLYAELQEQEEQIAGLDASLEECLLNM